MNRYLLILTTVIMCLKLAGSALAFCPGDPGVCDTLYAFCQDSVKCDTPPWEIHVSLLVTHDIVYPEWDSINAFEIPLRFEHTNPAAYCSIPSWKNSTSFTDTANSIFRHFGGLQNRMMSLYEKGEGEEWNQIILNLTHPYFCLFMIASGIEDRRWWEGSRILLATITFLAEDTMTIRLDTTILGPTGARITFCTEVDAYIPEDNMPYYAHLRVYERGDANGDQVINIADVLYMINYLFRHGSPPISFEVGDANCDNDHGILDVALLINYLYKGGPSPGCP